MVSFRSVRSRGRFELVLATLTPSASSCKQFQEKVSETDRGGDVADEVDLDHLAGDPDRIADRSL